MNQRLRKGRRSLGSPKPPSSSTSSSKRQDFWKSILFVFTLLVVLYQTAVLHHSATTSTNSRRSSSTTTTSVQQELLSWLPIRENYFSSSSRNDEVSANHTITTGSSSSRLRRDMVGRTKRKNMANRFFTRIPIYHDETVMKLVWFARPKAHKLYEPVYRAFHSRGYSVTQDRDRAHVLWTDQPGDISFKGLKRWQRYNQFPQTKAWDDKDHMAAIMNEYFGLPENQNKPRYYFPESYVCRNINELLRFHKRLVEGGGMGLPWVVKQPTVNQGKGVTIVGPNSNELNILKNNVQDVVTLLEKEQEENKANPTALMNVTKQDVPEKKSVADRLKRLVIQQYICNEMTLNQRKFDFRVFWMVASVDPLVVLYHTKHNYVRIGHAKYDEGNFNSTRSHLTTHTFGANEGKATWSQFQGCIEDHYRSNEGRLRQHVPLEWQAQPFEHVQNQIMAVLAQLADAYKGITFHADLMTPENGFSWHAADLIVDNDLDVFLIEGTDGPGKDEDYDFRIEMHNVIFGEVVDILEDVTARQQRPDYNGILNVEDMQASGVFGGFEVVYNNGWMFEYDYERAEKKGCNAGRNEAPSASLEDTASVAVSSPSSSKLTTSTSSSQSSFAKTFFMPGRTSRKGEGVTRSFRRNGWIPVDRVADAQVVYVREYEVLTNEEDGLSLQNMSSLRPWQYISYFPFELIFFNWNTRKHVLDRSIGKDGAVCDPMLYNGRDMRIQVYWLVLSLEPLIVLYHDGFMDISYDKDDEYEFMVDLHSDNFGSEANRGDLVWRGSWKSFEHELRAATPVDAKAQKMLNRLVHVKNQFKRSLVRVAEEFHRQAVQYVNEAAANTSRTSFPTFPSSFALYSATFEVDRNLNAFLYDVDHFFIEGEYFQDIVDLHDDLYGSAINLLETLIHAKTEATDKGNGKPVSMAFLDPQETRDDDGAMGGYEVLIRGDEWKFQYEWDGRAKECELVDDDEDDVAEEQT